LKKKKEKFECGEGTENAERVPKGVYNAKGSGRDKTRESGKGIRQKRLTNQKQGNSRHTTGVWSWGSTNFGEEWGKGTVHTNPGKDQKKCNKQT